MDHRGIEEGELPVPAHRLVPFGAYAAVVVACGLAAMVGVAVSAPPIPDLHLLVEILFAQAAGTWACGWLQRKLRSPVWQVDGAVLAAAMVLLPWQYVVLTLSLGLLIGLLLERGPIGVALTFLPHCVIAYMVGAGGASLLPQGRPGTWGHIAIVVAGCVVLSVITTLLADVRNALTLGDPLITTAVSDLRFAVIRTPFVASLGYSAGLGHTISPGAGLVAVPSMVAMVHVLAEHFRAERDRHRAEVLFHTAEAAYRADVDSVVGHVTAAADQLLGEGRVAVRLDAPRAGEVARALDVRTGSWLVVDGADPDDEALLGAVAAVGAAALDNARLMDELRHQALHDKLTDLPNHVLFDDRVDQAVAASGRSRERFAVVAIDLDAFRKVNDSLGHAAGDRLLQVVAGRLTDCVRLGDTVARLSGDSFMVLLPGVGTAESAGVLTEKLLAAVSRPIDLDGQPVFMTASAGLAFHPDDGQVADHLLRNADSALHRAKAGGPGSYRIYALGMNELAHQRLARESELHQAVRRDELRVRYQPQVDLRTGRIVSVEALVRWEHPTLGLLSPVEFVPLAEESGLVVDVDTWVLRRSARRAAGWLRQGLAPVRVGVNLSARHFQSPERLIGTIVDVLTDTGLPPMLLELEVTEGLAITEDESALVLQRIRDLGVSIAIDDFGTGYSMLGRLSRFPVDRLKIDRSFVREIRTAQADAPIVAAIIAMARSLKIETVAEGVETLEQATYLRNRSCDLAQGFLYSHPTDENELVRLLQIPSIGINLSSSVG